MERVAIATIFFLLLGIHSPVSAASSSLAVRLNELSLLCMKTAGVSPPRVARTLALVHIGMLKLDSRPGWTASARKAAEVEFARQLLREEAPAQAATIDQEAAAIVRDYALPAGEPIGTAAAQVLQTLLDWRANDAQAMAGGEWPAGDERHWNPSAGETPVLPNWGTAASFLTGHPTDWRLRVPEVPYPMPDDERVAITLRLGGRDSAARTAEMSQIALFWSQGARTVTPPGQWNRVAQDAVSRLGLGHRDSLRLFAQLNTAMAEVSVHCWAEKYRHLVLRPVQVARAYGDTQWNSFLETPPHPEYPSGHSSFSGAAAEILDAWSDRFASRDAGRIRITSEDLPGVVRTFSTYAEAAREAGMSRVYGGIHFLWSDTEGQKLGKAIAREVMKEADQAQEGINDLNLVD